MVNQTHQIKSSIRTTHHHDSAPRNLAVDLLQLGELQVELLRVDALAALRAVRVGSYMAIGATGAMVAAAPILLLALATWLEAAAGLTQPVSLLVSGAVALVASGVLLATAWESVGEALMSYLARGRSSGAI